MRLIPSTIHTPCSNAEIRVFDMLGKTECKEFAAAIHSLNIPEHQYKHWAELDFAVIGPSGLYVLEVKGGGVECDSEGIWHFRNRYGEEYRKSESPFDQARTGMYALRRMLQKEFGHELKNLCFGWGVIFCDIPFTVKALEIPAEVVLDAHGFKNAGNLVGYLRQVSGYWRAKDGYGRLSASSGVVDRVIRYLRPTFDLVPSVGASVDRAYGEMVRLTEEQYEFIDAVEGADRIICEGGAGTGKSFLAAEVARRESFIGRSVLLVCRSPVFAEFMRARIPNQKKVSISDWDRLVREVESHRIVPGSFDTLIVDEGQDLMDLYCFDIFGKCLRGGLEKGRWRFFMDPNNQGSIYDSYDMEALEWLRSLGVTPLILRRNCRNTEQIVFQTMLMTGGDTGRAIIEGEGPKVIYRYLPGSRETAKALSAQLTEWVSDGIFPGNITILSPASPENSCVRFLNHRWQSILLRITPEHAGGWPQNRLTFASIKDFKGLENRVIAIVDLERFDRSERAVSEIYVGMTRANVILWIAIPEKVRSLIEAERAEHAVKLANFNPGGSV